MRSGKQGDQYTGDPTGLLQSSEKKVRKSLQKSKLLYQGKIIVYDGSEGPTNAHPKERDNKHPNHHASTIRRSTRTYRDIRMRTGSGVLQTDPAVCLAVRWTYNFTGSSSL